jgi:phosphoenolpyruvate synthase/pyruvate phosphate dikinase
MKYANSYVLSFGEIDKTKLAIVGGKGANLGELSRIDGVRVPDGFCVTTSAFKEITGNNNEFNSLLGQLSRVRSNDRKAIAELSAKTRKVVEDIVVPKDLSKEIEHHLKQFGENDAYAVRSSATAEDLPTASFAGQQDTYLNVIGTQSILEDISKCWASLFTERAVTYRIQNGFDHGKVQLSVVIQKMVFPTAAGILFTADPITSNRKILSIDASFGLGEALVSGLVNADNYKVRDNIIVDKKVSTKKLAIYPLKEGGTTTREIEISRQDDQSLSDEQILRLARIGRKIEEHFGTPQDIEWCLVDDTFYVVQSRPITTLFPIPVETDNENHVYISVGHQQMMTDAFKPLGLSFRQLLTPMRVAGGRLFADVTPWLASSVGRENFLDMAGQSDPLIKDALMTVLERGDFIKVSDAGKEHHIKSHKGMSSADILKQAGDNPNVANDLIEVNRSSVNELKKVIDRKSGVALLDFILEDIGQFKKILFDPRNMGVIMAAMNAAAWINDKMNEWLGEKNAYDTLSQSLSNNVTSEMGMALLDVADVIRPYPEVIEYLQHLRDDNFLDVLPKFEGGKQVADAIRSFLDQYGMRCVGEIDITRTRWSEKPNMLVPLILSNIKNLEPGAGHRKFEQGRRQALQKKEELLERLRQLPDGEQKANETEQMIDLVRNLAGYREYPKYGMVARYYVYKQALMKEAERLVQANVLRDKEDIYYLFLEELREVAKTSKIDYHVIDQRKQEFKSYEKLTPPRVLTSDGEVITGNYKREDLPSNAIVGLAVSSGVVEGRARVISNIEDADLEEGDILVTSFTDPSWTPLFISIKGLITEVGGLMTHGAVIAREYGLPAVVGVENATKLIRDGQRIRVNGTDGYVEVL